MESIQQAGSGIVIYLRQEGRGIGLLNKLKAYALQEQGLDTVEANIALGFAPELRDFKAAADILKDCGIDSVRLLTNNPLKVKHLEQCGIEVYRQAHQIPASCQNEHYLRTKRDKMGHILQKLTG
jgi:3,4-dihydroxy 2-butanone 4-phosphate synthase/GTP cyclohydrolase II